MSQATRSLYRVELADGAVHDVWADQRDWAAAEGQNFPPAQIMTFVRYMIYNAMRREKLYVRPWKSFNCDDAVMVDDITPSRDDDSDGEDEQRLDPGQTDLNGAGDYFSRSRADSRSEGPAAFFAGTHAT